MDYFRNIWEQLDSRTSQFNQNISAFPKPPELYSGREYFEIIRVLITQYHSFKTNDLNNAYKSVRSNGYGENRPRTLETRGLIIQITLGLAMASIPDRSLNKINGANLKEMLGKLISTLDPANLGVYELEAEKLHLQNIIYPILTTIPISLTSVLQQLTILSQPRISEGYLFFYIPKDLKILTLFQINRTPFLNRLPDKFDSLDYFCIKFIFIDLGFTLSNFSLKTRKNIEVVLKSMKSQIRASILQEKFNIQLKNFKGSVDFDLTVPFYNGNGDLDINDISEWGIELNYQTTRIFIPFAKCSESETVLASFLQNLLNIKNI
jgi:hypothetical protein